MKFQHNKIWRWYVNRNIATQCVDLYWMGEGTNGKSFYRSFTTIEEYSIEAGEILNPDKPTLALEYEQADTLMQEMWNAGLRPKGVETGQAHVDALHKHIESLQKTVDHFMYANAMDAAGDLDQVAGSSFDKLNTDFGVLWNKVEAIQVTLNNILENMQLTKKIAESIQFEEKNT